MRMKLNSAVAEAMEPSKAVICEEALNVLSELKLDAECRWRVMQLEHSLIEKTEVRDMDEP